MRDIIKEFNEDEEVFAKDAVLYARENKGKINDILLKEVECFVNNMSDYEDNIPPISFVYAVYLLAEFEDKRLFKLLVKLYKERDYKKYDFLGDELSNRLRLILVSVFDNDFESLNSIIEDKKINEYVRAEFLDTYIYFYDHEMISSKDLKDYLIKLIELYDYKKDFIYNTILDVIINAHFFDMKEEVQKLFYYDVIDLRMRGGYDSFIDLIFNYEDNSDKFDKIKDTIKEMSWWACFNNNENPNINYDKINEFMESEQAKIKPLPKVGRNDPCPCGSGKKYKKCCMDKNILYLPYQAFIDESLSKYPKVKTNKDQLDLYDFYKEEYIEVDKLLYKVLKFRRLPKFVERDYETENRIDFNYLNDAFEKIKKIEEKEKFKTITEYDKKVSIHYGLCHFFAKYSDILINLAKKSPIKKEIYMNDLEKLIDFFYENFDLKIVEENIFIDRKVKLYKFKKKEEECIKFLEDILDTCVESVRYDVYENLVAMYMDVYDYDEGMNKIDMLIENEKEEELKEYLHDLMIDYCE